MFGQLRLASAEQLSQIHSQRGHVSHSWPARVPKHRFLTRRHPFTRKRRLPVTGRRAEQDDPRLGLIEDLRKPRALDDVTRSRDLRRRYALNHHRRGRRLTPCLLRLPPLVQTQSAPSSPAWLEGDRARGTRAGPGLPSAPSADRGRRELTGEGVLPRERPEGGRNLPPPRDSELLSKDVAVRLCRAGRDPEALSHFVVRAAECDQPDHLQLPLGEPRHRVAWSPCHGRETTPRPARPPLADRSIRRMRRGSGRARTKPRARARWPRPARPASARRSAAGDRARRGDACASSRGRPSRSRSARRAR
jgi:hypothetical protein